MTNQIEPWGLALSLNRFSSASSGSVLVSDSFQRQFPPLFSLCLICCLLPQLSRTVHLQDTSPSLMHTYVHTHEYTITLKFSYLLDSLRRVKMEWALDMQSVIYFYSQKWTLGFILHCSPPSLTVLICYVRGRSCSVCWRSLISGWHSLISQLQTGAFVPVSICHKNQCPGVCCLKPSGINTSENMQHGHWAFRSLPILSTGCWDFLLRVASSVRWELLMQLN